MPVVREDTPVNELFDLASWASVSPAPGSGATDSEPDGASQGVRRRRSDGAADSAQSSEQVTLTYYCLLISTLVLETFGLIMVFSVQSVTVAANGGNAFTDFAKYLVFAVVGDWAWVGGLPACHCPGSAVSPGRCWD